MEFGFTPEGESAGAVGTVGPVAMADGADGLGLIGVMEGDPLGIGLAGLGDDGLAIHDPEGGRLEVARAVEGAESVEAVEPGEGSHGAWRWGRSFGAAYGAGVGLLVPGVGEDLVDKLPFVFGEAGLRIGVDALGGVLKEAGEAGLTAAELEGEGGSDEAKECAEAVGEGGAGLAGVAAGAGLKPGFEDLEGLASGFGEVSLAGVTEVEGEADEFAAGWVYGVEVDGEDVFGAELAGVLLEAFAEAPGADGVAHGPSAEAEGKGVEGSDGAVVGAQEVALGGGEGMGQEMGRKESAPVVVRLASGAGGVPLGVEGVAGADWDGAEDGVTDVALGISEHAIGAGKAPAGEGAEEGRRVGGADHGEDRLEGVAIGLAEGNAFQGDLGLAVQGGGETPPERGAGGGVGARSGDGLPGPPGVRLRGGRRTPT